MILSKKRDVSCCIKRWQRVQSSLHFKVDTFDMTLYELLLARVFAFFIRTPVVLLVVQTRIINSIFLPFSIKVGRDRKFLY